MKVERTTTIKLSEDDIREAVLIYLENKRLIKAGEKIKVSFDTSKHTEEEDLFSPGYDVIEFNGCTVTIHRK